MDLQASSQGTWLVKALSNLEAREELLSNCCISWSRILLMAPLISSSSNWPSQTLLICSNRSFSTSSSDWPFLDFPWRMNAELSQSTYG